MEQEFNFREWLSDDINFREKMCKEMKLLNQRLAIVCEILSRALTQEVAEKYKLISDEMRIMFLQWGLSQDEIMAEENETHLLEKMLIYKKRTGNSIIDKYIRDTAAKKDFNKTYIKKMLNSSFSRAATEAGWECPFEFEKWEKKGYVKDDANNYNTLAENLAKQKNMNKYKPEPKGFDTTPF